MQSAMLSQKTTRTHLKNVLRAIFVLVVAVVLPSTAGAAEGQQKVWTTSTFLDFVDGTLSDGGVNTYISRDGTIRLINLWDLNNDGHFDLSVTCPQNYEVKPALTGRWLQYKATLISPNSANTPLLESVSIQFE